MHTVWRPLDGATLLDTEERICGACWLVEDDRGAGRGDHGRDMVEDESELRRVKRNEYQRQWRHKKRMAIKRAPSASAVLPPRFILQGVALASPDSTESQVEDTEDPWELQRLHDAWLAKEFFHAKKQYPLYGPRVCLDCGKRMDYYSMSKHRRFYCKSRQPVALDSVRQGRPAEKDAVLEPPPPPEAPLDVAGSSDRRAASRSRSPRAPRRRGPHAAAACPSSTETGGTRTKLQEVFGGAVKRSKPQKALDVVAALGSDSLHMSSLISIGMSS